MIVGALIAHAGFSERGQAAFVVLAAAAILGLGAFDPGSVRRGLREPVVVAIWALAALGAASAAWTIGEPGDALRWGAVIGGYGVVAVAGFAVGRRGGAEPAAALLVGLAVAAGAIGLAAAAAQSEPFAERIGGAWRPGGPFEYPPALGALQLAAAPLCLRWMAAAGSRAILGAGALTIGSAAVALVSTRAILALGALLLLALAWRPRDTIGVERPLALATIAFALSAGAAADAIAGSYADPYVATPDLPRVAGLIALLAAAPALWIVLRACFDERGDVHAGFRRRAIALALVPLLATSAAAALTPDAGEAVEPDAGLTHGRIEIWGDAIETAVEGPFEGSGALTFLEASSVNQDPPPARFAHDLVLEQWVELGYPGLVLALALVAISIVLVVRSLGGAAGWLLGPGAIAYLVAMLIDWLWHVPAAAAIFAFILGALASCASAPGSAAPSPARPAAF